MLKYFLCCARVATVCAILASACLAQTPGRAQLDITLLDYNGSSSKHYTVVWVTTESGAFIKSLRKQGPSSWTSKEWNDHCQTWNTARAGSTSLDGYTSATASGYSGTNSPVVCAWDGRDASNQLVPDGKYKFWVQYAENSGQGPHTTGGLLWTKGPAAATNSYPNQGANFTGMRVAWTPSASPPTAPTITSTPPPAIGTVGVPYSFTCTAAGTAPINFSASGLPAGVEISEGGVISGVPTTAGTFNGIVTAANGTLPNATQPFVVVVNVVPASIALATSEAGNVILRGTGPANGRYTIATSTNASLALSQWPALANGSFDGQGNFGFTNAINSSLPALFYLLRVP